MMRTSNTRHGLFNNKSEARESLIGSGYHGDTASPQQSPIVDSFNDDVRQSLVGVGFQARGAEEKVQLPPSSSEPGEPPEPPMHMVEIFCEAIHPYAPQVEDELALERGDIIYLIFQLDDGWGYGHNLVTSKTGVFPLMFVMEARQELLEQYFLPPTTTNDNHHQQDQFQEKTLVEDPGSAISDDAVSRQTPTSATSERSNASQRILEERMQRVRDDVRRSISLTSMRRISRIQRSSPPVWVQHHSTIPKRAASILRSPDGDFSTTPQCQISAIHENAESYEMRSAQ